MIPFVRDMDPQYGEVVQVAPLIRRVVARNPGPFTFLGTGTYLVGSGSVAVIDPGPDDADHLAALIRALRDDRVVAILTTHTHLDHSPLARPLQAAVGGIVYGRASPIGAPDAEAFAPDVSLAEDQEITGPGWTLRAIATPGHASNHFSFVFPEDQSLFCGDHVMGWSTTIVSPPDGHMGDYLASLEKVAGLTVQRLWPTHGPPILDVPPFLTAYRDHRLERERQVLDEVRAGNDDIPQIVASLYRDVDPKLHLAAARSVSAHLIHLTETGDVIRTKTPSGVDRFTSAC
jgi:glyoxylase-like metal-dependent hydrolase (beta-lactamase superfamily II)